MGLLSEDNAEFVPVQSDPDTSPGSPRLAATHARAIADTYTSDNSEINTQVLRDYASLCCEELGITDVDKDDVLRTSQMNPRLIAVRQYARVAALTQNVNQLLTESFLESAEFKDHVTHRIQATFLDADIPTYVRGCTARLIQHMQENPASWHIPPVVHAHFVNSKVFRKAVAAIASNARDDMRRKIKKSMTDNSDIGAFAKKLCVKGYQPTVGHWRRFALLRSCMIDWEKLPVKPGKGRGMSYWAFIDTKFDELQLQCAKPTEKETQRLIEDMLKGNLKDDQSRYKGPASGATKLPAKIHLPEWQQNHAQAVKDMSAYTVDPSVDDDIDDDDSTIEAPATEALLCADDTIEDLGNADDTEEDLGSSHFNPLARSADVDENKRDWRSEKGSLLTSDESPAKAEAEVSMPAPGVEHSQLQRSPNYSIPPVNLPPLPSVLPSSTRWNTTFIPDPPRAVGDRYTPSWPLSSDNIPDLWEPTLMEHNLARSFQELDIRSSSIDWQPKPSRSIFSQSGTSNQARQQTKSRVPNRATLQDFERLVQYPSGNQDMLLLYVGTDSKYTLASNHAALMVRQSARSPDFLRRLQEATISLSLIAEFVEFIFSCKHLKPEQRGCLALRVCFSSLTALMGDFGSGEAPASDPNVPIVMRAALGTFRQCYDPVTLVIASLVEKLSKSINMYRYRRSPSTSVACKFQSMLRTLETWNVGLDDRTFHEPIAIIQSWLTSHSNQVSSNWVRGTNVQSSPNMSETISSPAQATSGSSVKPLENIPDACEPQPTQSNL